MEETCPKLGANEDVQEKLLPIFLATQGHYTAGPPWTLNLIVTFCVI